MTNPNQLIELSKLSNPALLIEYAELIKLNERTFHDLDAQADDLEGAKKLANKIAIFNTEIQNRMYGFKVTP